MWSWAAAVVSRTISHGALINMVIRSKGASGWAGRGLVFGVVFWSNPILKSGGRVGFLESFFGRIPD